MPEPFATKEKLFETNGFWRRDFGNDVRRNKQNYQTNYNSSDIEEQQIEQVDVDRRFVNIVTFRIEFDDAEVFLEQ